MEDSQIKHEFQIVSVDKQSLWAKSSGLSV